MGRDQHVEPALHPSRLVSRWARLLVFVLVYFAAACLQAPARPANPDWVVEFQRGRYGGLCAGPDGAGGCQVTITVHDDGRWSAEGFPEAETPSGAVAEGAASGLAAILEEGWPDLTGSPFTGTCPVAYDGQESFYVIRRLPQGPGAERADATVREIRSCTYDLARPEAARWIAALEERWQELGLPD
ncbi:MAG: hypothetical protein HKN72_13315 [Gemmatimonadetes bacterium]|nr:hypothetical protein [Gemmatimonadota bacterium]